MAQHLLDLADVGAVIQEIRGEGVAKAVGIQPARHADCALAAQQDFAESTIGERSPASIQEEPFRARPHARASLHVGAEGLAGLFAEKYDAILSPLSRYAKLITDVSPGVYDAL